MLEAMLCLWRIMHYFWKECKQIISKKRGGKLATRIHEKVPLGDNNIAVGNWDNSWDFVIDALDYPASARAGVSRYIYR